MMNVKAKLFADDSLWDTVSMYDGNQFVKKCKSILGINWCYCRSRESAWPWPCFGLPFKLTHNKQQPTKKVLVSRIGKRQQQQLLTQTGKN